MKKSLKSHLDRLFGWCPLYQIACGGYRYYVFEKQFDYKAADFLHFGKACSIGEHAMITVPKRCHLGDYSWIGARCNVNAVGGFHFGNYSTMGFETQVFTTEHRYAGAATLPFDSVRLVKPVHIGDYVWIGARASIHAGVKIGDGAIVGMSAVVTQDVPPLAIVAGNPAVVVGRRTEEEYRDQVKSGRFRNPRQQCDVLWVPPYSARKHMVQLERCGFNVAPGETCFVEDRATRALTRIPTAEGLQSTKPDGHEVSIQR